MKWDVGTISVISSGIIAISSLLFPFIFNLIGDSLKWKRETKASEAQKIDEASVKLLENLSYYRSGRVQEAIIRPERETYSKLLSQYYSWERIVWVKCKQGDRERLKKLRINIENGDANTFYKETPTLANEI